MESLHDYNRRKRAEYEATSWDSSVPTPNGLACPQCGVELMDTDPGVTLMSNPPQKAVHCEACGHQGYRVA
jgi:hypothetical protein